jgi:hypothetical protein
MAGRPKTTAKRIADLEAIAYQLSVDVSKARPQQYADREGREADDDLALAWNEAAAAVKEAAAKMDALLYFIEDKAGYDADERDLNRLLKRGIVSQKDWETSVS